MGSSAKSLSALVVAVLVVLAALPSCSSALFTKEQLESGRPMTIPLKRASANDKERAVVLMQLKERHENPAVMLELMAQDVPLKQQILSEKHLATYFGSIELGGDDPKERTTVDVLFDTGSCELWMPSSACGSDRCAHHTKFPVSEEYIAKHQIKSGAHLNINYLSGKVQGALVYETVRLGDLVVKNQVVGLASTVDIELLDDVRWSGILGLAYPNPALTRQGVLPLMDTIISSGVLSKKHLANQMAYYIDDTAGAVTFGGANCELIGAKDGDSSCVDRFSFVPVSEQTYWTVMLDDVKLSYPNSKNCGAGGCKTSGFCPPEGCKAIVDTGTYLLYGPSPAVSDMGIGLRNCADHASMPTFTFVFKVNEGAAPVELTLKPEDYILKFQVDDRADCVVGISPDQDTIWTLGQVFLRSFYTVFDRDENRVGFARLQRRGFNALQKKKSSFREKRHDHHHHHHSHGHSHKHSHKKHHDDEDDDEEDEDLDDMATLDDADMDAGEDEDGGDDSLKLEDRAKVSISRPDWSDDDGSSSNNNNNGGSSSSNEAGNLRMREKEPAQHRVSVSRPDWSSDDDADSNNNNNEDGEGQDEDDEEDDDDSMLEEKGTEERVGRRADGPGREIRMDALQPNSV